LSLALSAIERRGGTVRLFGGNALRALPHYGAQTGTDASRELLAAVRQADGLILASPGYHGSVSGLVKNAIDHLEETARDPRPYLQGMPVGLIATAYGWQATGSTLAALRSIVHALRGWPTPFGAAINSSATPFQDGACSDSAIADQLTLVGHQVFDFAVRQMEDRAAVA
jgi:FMN reductase